MSHEIAKLLLEHSTTFLDRTAAIKEALKLGMPLHEIEAYLDWTENVKNSPAPADKTDSQPVAERD